MLKLTADFILDPQGNLMPNLQLIVEDNGRIVDLIAGIDSDTIAYEGIICPGFINTHCHLEFSHLKNKIDPGKGLSAFINDIIKMRPVVFPDQAEMKRQDNAMWNNGIQGVGDICNTTDSFETKKNSKIRYYSFIELFTFQAASVDKVISEGLKRYYEAKSFHQDASLTPHAPYSVHPELFYRIKEWVENTKNLCWSIHNQESAAENEMFISRAGDLLTKFEDMHVDLSWFNASNTNSLPAIIPYLPTNKHLLFVHNTFTSKQDLDTLKKSTDFSNYWFAVCPKANLYIENTIPNIQMLYNQQCKITIGTDSLASNNSLSILEEIKTISTQLDGIPLSKLLTWATKNGADFFGWDDLGSFMRNNIPGVIQITHANENALAINSVVNRII